MNSALPSQLNLLLVIMIQELDKKSESSQVTGLFLVHNIPRFFFFPIITIVLVQFFARVIVVVLKWFLWHCVFLLLFCFITFFLNVCLRRQHCLLKNWKSSLDCSSVAILAHYWQKCPCFHYLSSQGSCTYWTWLFPPYLLEDHFHYFLSAVTYT